MKMEFVARFVLTLLGLYLFLGFLFTPFFILLGLNKIDEDVRGSSFWFRMIIIPGCLVFWPLLLRKWVKAIRK